MLYGKMRVILLIRQAKLRSVRGYKRLGYRAGKSAVAASNRLQRQFTLASPIKPG